MSKSKFTVKKLAFCGVAVGLAFVLSNIRLFRMPSGGSVTLFSMLAAALPGFFFGPFIGLASSFAYSLLQFVTNPYIVSFWQVMFDYIFAFTALGLSGFFHRKKHGLLIGYIAAILGRFVSTTLASLLFWTDFTGISFAEGLWGCLAYNGAYIGTEGAVTVVLLLLPPVRKSLSRVKKLSCGETDK